MADMMVHHAVAWSLGADYKAYMREPGAPPFKGMLDGVYVTWYFDRSLPLWPKLWSKRSQSVLGRMSPCAEDPRFLTGTLPARELLTMPGKYDVLGLLDEFDHVGGRGSEAAREQGFKPVFYRSVLITKYQKDVVGLFPSVFLVHKTPQPPETVEDGFTLEGSKDPRELTVKEYLAIIAENNARELAPRPRK